MPDLTTTLRQRAYRVRRYALRMGEVQGQGYIGQALGWADVLAVAYGHALNYRADDPTWEGRDRFLLSHGHYAIAFYAVLIEAGIIAESELETYGSDDSRLPMSGMATYTPGMEMSGGSLGHGLPIAVGVALTGRRTFVLVGDGELDEGSNWEAVQYAGRARIQSLTAIVIDNASATYGWPGGIEERFALEGWRTRRVNGRDHDASEDALREPGGPRCVVAEVRD